MLARLVTPRTAATPARSAEAQGGPSGSSRLRIRQALVAAFALACFSATTPVQGTVLAQAQPGAPTADVPLAEPGQPVAVEVAMRMEDGALVCRPDLARLPSNEEMTLQLANLTDQDAAFSAPDFFAGGAIVTVIAAEYDEDATAFVVPADTTGQITLTTGAEGVYAFGCAAAGEEASMQGEFVIED